MLVCEQDKNDDAVCVLCTVVHKLHQFSKSCVLQTGTHVVYLSFSNIALVDVCVCFSCMYCVCTKTHAHSTQIAKTILNASQDLHTRPGSCTRIEREMTL